MLLGSGTVSPEPDAPPTFSEVGKNVSPGEAPAPAAPTSPVVEAPAAPIVVVSCGALLPQATIAIRLARPSPRRNALFTTTPFHRRAGGDPTSDDAPEGEVPGNLRARSASLGH